MSRKLKGKVCYYCGQQATGMEHIPPKCLFKGMACDHITVPACNKHNGQKSGADQVIVSALTKVMREPRNADLLTSNGKTVLSNMKSADQHVVNQVRRSPLPPLVGRMKNPLETVTVKQDIEVWARHITAALVYDALGYRDPKISWDKTATWSLNLLEPLPSFSPWSYWGKYISDNLRMLNLIKRVQWDEGWSASPMPYPADIYNFKLHISGNDIVFRHIFFGYLEYHVCIMGIQNATLSKIKLKASVT